jgi:hypothetical protein
MLLHYAPRFLPAPDDVNLYLSKIRERLVNSAQTKAEICGRAENTGKRRLLENLVDLRVTICCQ